MFSRCACQDVFPPHYARKNAAALRFMNVHALYYLIERQVKRVIKMLKETQKKYHVGMQLIFRKVYVQTLDNRFVYSYGQSCLPFHGGAFIIMYSFCTTLERYRFSTKTDHSCTETYLG